MFEFLSKVPYLLKIENLFKFVLQKVEKARASQVALVVKNPLANAGNIGDTGLIPGSGISPRGGNGNPLQYLCLGKPMDRGS